MIWWRGNGQLILFLACFPAVAADKLGATNTALAYAASAAIIFFLRDFIGAESSALSIPTKIWPVLLLCIALIVQFTSSKQPIKPSNSQKIATELKASLPRKLNEQIRIDQIDYDSDSKTLYYNGTSIVPFDDPKALKTSFEQQVHKHYCESSKSIWEADLSITFKLIVPPKSLNDRVESYSVNLHPKECKAVSS